MVFHRLAQGKALWAGAGLASALLLPGVALADKSETPKQVFDPEALERAAAAAREVNKSPHAKQILALSMQQETTKQAEAKKSEAEAKERAAENVRIAAQIEKERDSVRWEEERRLEEQRAQVGARMKQYEDELARKRLMHDHELQRNRNQELVKLQESERLRVEQQIQAERRAADAYAADLQKQVQREKALAEAEGRIKEARDNEDVNRRAAILKYQEEAKQALESINLVMHNLGQAALDVITNKEKMATVLGGMTLLFLGFYSTKETTRVIGRTVENWLGTPKLIRETSRFNIFSPKTWRVGGPKTMDQIKKDFSDIILPEVLHNNVRVMAAAATNTRLHGAPFRHIMFYGPPGTGKTMAAKRLARTSGLDYAIMSGGDVSQLGAKAVTQLHETFDWAEKSRRGLLLFIDEADAFLGRRSANMSEGLRGALNATLYRTGDQSKDFMVVLATNRPGDLDDAVIDRMDESLEFGLPTEAERRNILNLYFNSYISKSGTTEAGAGAGSENISKKFEGLVKGQKTVSDAIDVTEFDLALVDEAAKKTEGFSGRELAKFMASIQASSYGTVDGKLSNQLFRSVLERKLQEHQHRKEFQNGKNFV
eukprot:CAMPEP_0175066940 /NCGR_PEP_ID=MMETSP0052_2-20121109/16801_1 /TAXON_ID=51329 ORGANISM="Polytomella parva, Strain SAG 63-3" /NCGR_SAMPLE_ID=MMETSP0052_2 /ASSEMBLY_ACC=CAM_ASM_000194 /LENGTH=600 /DNA_ID=CAMNT_0016333725 /DNA_START=31 /DNA_END=1833 /DNA_ORIENTATION=+